jgi:hypothetical protein
VHGSGHPLDGESKIMNRVGWIGSRILDRASDKADLGGTSYRFGDIFGVGSEAILKVRRYGQISRINNGASVHQGLFAADRALGITTP